MFKIGEITQVSDNNEISETYKYLKDILDKLPFIVIIGKYDHVLGPRALFSSVKLKDENFIRNLLRDALNTKNKFVILNFNRFYSQIYKIEVDDGKARGGKQLYAIILLRDIEHPLIPILHFKRIGMIFYQIGQEKILSDDEISFDAFFRKVKDIYMKKDELLPLESVNMQIRSGVNTIQGFCELIHEQLVRNEDITTQEIINFIELTLESCEDITQALEKPI